VLAGSDDRLLRGTQSANPGFQFPRVPVRQKTEIRSDGRFFSRLLANTAKHALLRSGTKYAAIGEMHPAEVVDARVERMNGYLIRMQFEIEAVA